nr:diguanylate cyclase [uncultured Holophaga sp.]
MQTPDPEAPASAPSVSSALALPHPQEELLACEELAQRTQDSGFRWMRFPQPLEQRFEGDSTRARVGRFRFYGVVAIILINLFGLGDLTMVPDVATTAILLRLTFLTPVITVISVLLARPWFSRNREWLAAFQILVTALTLNLVVVASHHPNALHYHIGVMVVSIFGVILVRQRFWFAMGTSALISLIYTLGLYQMPGLPPEVRSNAITVLVATVIICLIASYQIEHDLRRGYLQALLQRIKAIRLRDSHDALAQLSKSDPLTGLANRRQLLEHLELAWNIALRTASPISLLFMDVDHFKEYNDHWGHQAGDVCLAAVAELLSASAHRSADLCARYGGEEFVLLLPYTTIEGALPLAQRIRRLIESSAIPHGHSPVSAVVTISCGVACLTPTPDRTSADLIDLADRALYQAKRNGRNRVHAAI